MDHARGWISCAALSPKLFFARSVSALFDRRSFLVERGLSSQTRYQQRHCEPRELACRKRQRQALLHWAYDSRQGVRIKGDAEMMLALLRPRERGQRSGAFRRKPARS